MVVGQEQHEASAPAEAVGAPPAADRSPNAALWLTAKLGGLEVRAAPYTPPRADEIVVRNRAVAVNPVDWITRSIGDLFLPWLTYPTVLGSDVAGEVVAVGSAVSRFKRGDRVLGHAVGTEKARNTPAEGAFQHHTVLLERMASPIPDWMAYERAAVLPLGLSTAACGLFQADFLALRHPSAGATPTGRTLLVWGGATSVGSNAIQLAAAAGYDVIATASPKNFDYVRALGARLAFDYRSPRVVADIVEACEGRTIAGALAIGAGSARPCLAVVDRCKGNRFVAIASPAVAFDTAPTGRRRMKWLIPTLVRVAAGQAALMIRARRRRIGTKFIWGAALMDNEVGRLIYADFLPAALAERRYVPAPEPMIAGHGLEAIPAALEVQKSGVSARKVVVLL